MFFIRAKMESFVPNKRHLREALLFCFNFKKSAAESHRMLQRAYGEHALDDSTCRRWFRQFKEGIFDIEDAQRPGHQKKFEDEELQQLPSETITGDVYRRQLMRLKRAVEEKRPEWVNRHNKLIFQHDNAKPHTVNVVKNYLQGQDWEVLSHPLYSPDIAPSDYHLFRLMQLALQDVRFTSYESIKKWLDEWIASKDEEFFRQGIRQLPERWAKVVAFDGSYFD